MTSYGRVKRGPMAADVLGPEHCVFVNDEVFKDPRLSFRAKGLLAYLASYGSTIAGSVKAIAQGSSSGERATAAALRELDKFGYLIRTQGRTADGTLGPNLYCIPTRFAYPGSTTQEDSPFGPAPQSGPLDSRGWAYAITAGPEFPVKIGKAQNVNGRLSSLQTGSPQKLKVIWSAPGGHALESHLHDTFEDRRIRGEWFDFAGVDAVSLITKAASVWDEVSR